MSVGAEDQRRRSNQWRAVVSITLRALGIADAESRPAARRVSEEAFTFLPDVGGVPGVHIKASPIAWSRVSDYLNQAVLAADENGAGDLPVLCMPRQDHESTESYVVMRLCDFAKLAMDAAKGRSQATDADLASSEV